MESTPGDVTLLLAQWRNGDATALDKLIPLIHDELRRLAHNFLKRERVDHTLQTTALINEAYIRLSSQNRVDWQSRAHFFAVSSQLMRRILVDYARSRNYVKRGGGSKHVSLDEVTIATEERGIDLLALDEALSRLAQVDTRKVQIVELRYFGGLDHDEVAEVIGVSAITVKREWARARAWLYRELSQAEENEA